MTRRGLFGLLAGTATATAKPASESLRLTGLQLDPYRLSYACPMLGDFRFGDDGVNSAELTTDKARFGYCIAINDVLIRNATLADKQKGFALCRALPHIREWWQRTNGRSEREAYRIIRGDISFVWWPDRLYEAGRESTRSRALREDYPFDAAAGSSFLPNVRDAAIFEFSRKELAGPINWDSSVSRIFPSTTERVPREGRRRDRATEIVDPCPS